MNLNDPIFQDADKARVWLENQRWPHGPFCPHCGNSDQTKIKALQGKSHRAGLYQCAECREQFTVTVGTVFERSKIALNKWVLATYLLNSSKKGMSAHQIHQIHRILGVTYKTAWFMCHRIRLAMQETTGPANPMGGAGKIVEADETYYGKKADKPKVTTSGRPFLKGGMGAHKIAIVSLVERGGSVRSFHVDGTVSAKTVADILYTNVTRDTALHTDESRLYTVLGKEFASHATVNHGAKEYARGDVHTNTIEGYFSIFKRGMKGVYQHCGEKHLHRYLAEFDFRYNHRANLGFTLKFAFWVSLFTSRHDGRLWAPNLAIEFPNAPAVSVSTNRAKINQAADQVRELRNRIAHHEPIFRRDLMADYAALLEVIGYKCALTAAWVNRSQSVSNLLTLRP
jgi:transposase-like protein